jgi:hypothetical protein
MYREPTLVDLAKLGICWVHSHSPQYQERILQCLNKIHHFWLTTFLGQIWMKIH